MKLASFFFNQLKLRGKIGVESAAAASPLHSSVSLKIKPHIYLRTTHIIFKSVQIQRFQDEQQKFKPKHCPNAQWIQ